MSAENYPYHPLCGNVLNPNREEGEPLQHEPLGHSGVCQECEQARIVEQWARLQEQDRIIEQLELCREGRLEYAAGSTRQVRNELVAEAETLAMSILIAGGNLEPLYACIPSWRWESVGLPSPLPTKENL